MSLTAAIRREYVYLSAILRTLWLLREVTPNSSRTIVDIVEGFARRTPHAPAVYFQDEVMSYAQLDARANRYANWAIAQGHQAGGQRRPDDGKPAGFSLLLAGTVQGGRRGGADQHQPASAAFGPFHRDCRRPACGGGQRTGGLRRRSGKLFHRQADGLGGRRGGNLDAALAAASPLSPGKAPRAGITGRSRAFYIYTSGTTGLPKAANFSHNRMLFMMTGFVGALQPKSSDRIYDPLPLYHATGGVCAVGLACWRAARW